MKKHSAGILLYRQDEDGVEVLLVHPGGPFWVKKDLGSWSIPKGELDEDEELLPAAKREFAEEMGAPAPEGDYPHLGQIKMSSGKCIDAFCLENNFDLEHFKSNMFSMEWPPKSGTQQEFPENDKAAWLPLGTARQKLIAAQLPLLDALAERLGVSGTDVSSGTQASLF